MPTRNTRRIVPTVQALMHGRTVRPGTADILPPVPMPTAVPPPAAQRPARAEMAGWAVCGGDPDATELDGVCWHRGWHHPVARAGYRAKDAP